MNDATEALQAQIIQILTLLAHTTSSAVGGSLQFQGKGLALLSGGAILFEVGQGPMKLVRQGDVTTELLPSRPVPTCEAIDTAKLQAFFAALSGSIVRLNHLGISYSCANTNKEITRYVALLRGTGFTFYEEPSGSEWERWFFIGNRAEWKQPLFEVVLAQSVSPITTDWIPHFQIDLDTDLSIKQLENLTDRYLAPDFFRWKLDIKNYGVVLGMGLLANMYGTKIYLGLGTSLRGTERHRKYGLKDVEASVHD